MGFVTDLYPTEKTEDKMLRGFTIVISLLALALLCAPIAAQTDTHKPLPRDVAVDCSGNRTEGHIRAIDEDGTVHFADDRIADLSQIERIVFNTSNPLPPEAIRRALIYRLVDGTAFNAKLVAWSDDRVTLRTEFAGEIVVSADVLRGVECVLNFRLPREGRTDHDIVITAKEEIVCDVLPFKTEQDSYGKSLVCKIEYTVDGKTQSLPVRDVKGILFHNQDTLDPAEMPEGWYASVRLVNGDQFYGVLDGFAEGRLHLVTRCAGEVIFERRYLAEVAFSKRLGLDRANLLVCDQRTRQVFELDESLRTAWTYQMQGGSYPTFATHTPDDAFIIAYPNNLTMIKVDRNKKEIWRFTPNPRNPYIPLQAYGLANGNTVALFRDRTGRMTNLVELDDKGKEIRTLIGNGDIFYFEPIGDGRMIAFRNNTSSVVYLDRNGQPIKTAYKGSVNGLHALPGGGFAVLDIRKRQIISYSESGSQIGTIGSLDSSIRTFTVTPEGNILVYARDGGSAYKFLEYTPQGNKVSAMEADQQNLSPAYIGY